jgi:predicted N-acetyltransferase YhbS
MIRPLEKRDVIACTTIVNENWGSIVADRFWDEVEHAWLSNMKWPPIYFVYEDDGRVVGFAGMMESWIMHGVWDFIWINVRKSHQGTGVGRALTERRIEEVDRRRGSVINLYTHNPKFFEQFGFTCTHAHDDWCFLTKQLRKLQI